DLGMVQRLNYYTGITFRGYVEGVGAIALSGGRYDNLIALFGEDRPAVGFSINLDSLLDIMKNKNINIKESYKLYYGNKSMVEAFKQGEVLRNEGYVVEMIFDENLVGEVKKEKVGEQI
ncbi:MAG TPA: ATP phosphoribosyltransferase regulatory subunit, partial [Clostridium sp.]